MSNDNDTCEQGQRHLRPVTTQTQERLRADAATHVGRDHSTVSTDNGERQRHLTTVTSIYNGHYGLVSRDNGTRTKAVTTRMWA